MSILGRLTRAGLALLGDPEAPLGPSLSIDVEPPPAPAGEAAQASPTEPGIELCMGCCVERRVKDRLTLECGHESEVARLRRVHEENIKVVLQYMKERDYWRDAFLAQGRGHAEAQAHLETSAESLRTMLRGAINTINNYRKLDGHPPLDLKRKPGDPPAGFADRFRLALAVVVDAAEVDLEKRDPPVGLPPVTP